MTDINSIVELLKKEFPDVQVEVKTDRRALAEVPPEQILDVMYFMRDKMDRDFLASLSGADYSDRIEVVYLVGSYSDGVILVTKTKLSRDNPSVSSVVEVWPTAGFHEREAAEMFGITFEGHPNLEHLLLPEDFEGYPLRKDYKWW
ncbi:MAG TPA: NADH-quinone oxidoreductase subunit C [Archaeoglobaceae archaeon]|nr:NADH-quinone oxidoreductase subunit C [Archaeoglobaceae archaeon]